MSDLDILKSSVYLAGLTADQVKSIGDLAQKRTYQNGDLLIKESDVGDNLFFIISGRVDISDSLVGVDKTESIATLGAAEMVGEMVLLGKKRRSANVVAKGEVVALEWTIKQIEDFFSTDLKAGYTVMRNTASQLAERLSNTNQVLRNALTLPTSSFF